MRLLTPAEDRSFGKVLGRMMTPKAEMEEALRRRDAGEEIWPEEPEASPPQTLKEEPHTSDLESPDQGLKVTSDIAVGGDFVTSGIKSLSDIKSLPGIDISPLAHRGKTSIPNTILDGLYPILEPTVATIYLRLYRLSYGFHTETCLVSYATLATAVNLNRRTVIRGVEKLIQLGLIQHEGANLKKGPRGNLYRVLLPPVLTPELVTSSHSPLKVTSDSAPPIKHTTLKKTHTHGDQKKPVGERGSRFSLEECRRYADHLHTTGQGIDKPGGYATTIFRSGEADALIEEFLNPPPEPAKIDPKDCPDCAGSGAILIEGKGVKICKHPTLAR